MQRLGICVTPGARPEPCKPAAACFESPQECVLGIMTFAWPPTKRTSCKPPGQTLVNLTVPASMLCSCSPSMLHSKCFAACHMLSHKAKRPSSCKPPGQPWSNLCAKGLLAGSSCSPSMLRSASLSPSPGLLYRQELYLRWRPSTSTKYSVGTCSRSVSF